MSDSDTKYELLTVTADVVSSFVTNNSVSVSDIAGLINSVHVALSALGSKAKPEKVQQKPAVPIKSSIKPDYIVCLEDGKKLKMLKRHLMIVYGLTPDAYRAKWNLPADYPMVAPAYAALRRSLALTSGLGRRVPIKQPPSPVEAVRANRPRSRRAELAPSFRKRDK